MPQKTVSFGGQSYNMNISEFLGSSQQEFDMARVAAMAQGAANLGDMSDGAASNISGTFNQDGSVDDMVDEMSDGGNASTEGGKLYFWTLEEAKDAEATTNSTTDVIPQYLESFTDKRGILSLVAMEENPDKPIYQTSEIFIQRLESVDRERLQVIQGFDSMHLQAFGRAPISVAIVGVLLNANNAQWYASFMIDYDKYFRATRAIENNARCVLSVDNRIIEGQLLSLSVQQDAQNPKSIIFSMPMVVYKITYVGQGVVSSENAPFSGTESQQEQSSGGVSDSTGQQSNEDKVSDKVIKSSGGKPASSGATVLGPNDISGSMGAGR